MGTAVERVRQLAVEQAKAAQKILKDLGPGRVLTRDALAQLGQEFWPRTYKGASPALKEIDYSAIDCLFQWLKQKVEDGTEREMAEALFYTELLKMPDQKIATMGAARWVDQGLPIIRLGHKHAAALMATNLSKETLEWVRPPWKAFGEPDMM